MAWLVNTSQQLLYLKNSTKPGASTSLALALESGSLKLILAIRRAVKPEQWSRGWPRSGGIKRAEKDVVGLSRCSA